MFVLAAAVALALVAPILLLRPVSAGAVPATVCGGLEPDDEYQAEVGVIGTRHACEHFKGRRAGMAHAGPAGRSTEGGRTSATVVNNERGVTPAEIGSWSQAVNPGTKTIGISAALFHTGEVLLAGGKYTSTDKNTASYLFDPVTGKGHEVPAPAAIFCGAVTFLSDGRMLSAGGADPIPKGIVDLWLFDPLTEQWSRQPDSPLGRYYPTATRLPDGRIIIAAGNELDGQTKNPTVEVYTPPAPGETMGSLDIVGPAHVTNFYPTQWVMPEARFSKPRKEQCCTGSCQLELDEASAVALADRSRRGGTHAARRC